MDKHYSLFRKFVNYDRKKIYNIGSWPYLSATKKIKFYSPSGDIWEYKKVVVQLQIAAEQLVE
jgi:hypothetical protein